jgi:hypothetical protein
LAHGSPSVHCIAIARSLQGKEENLIWKSCLLVCGLPDVRAKTIGEIIF